VSCVVRERRVLTVRALALFFLVPLVVAPRLTQRRRLDTVSSSPPPVPTGTAGRARRVRPDARRCRGRSGAGFGSGEDLTRKRRNRSDGGVEPVP